MSNQSNIPDSTAVRVALWRALHVQVDAVPHVLQDEIGMKLAAPPEGWKDRSDMHPQWTRGYRASIVGRARLIEEMVLEKMDHGINQYVILGAGLDTFAQRQPAKSSKLKIFEIDKPETQEWKKKRLSEIEYKIPSNLHFVPVDFEAGESWIEKLSSADFDKSKPALISSTGVAMYLTKEANFSTLKQLTLFAPGSVLAMTFMLPADLIPEKSEREQYLMVQERAKASGTPFLSFFTPNEILDLAKNAGFKKVEHISRDEIIKRYFEGRSDGLVPSHGEEFLVATV